MEPKKYPIIDLHEDISAYFLYHGGGYTLGDFGEDIAGRDADIPKYLKANVKCVFAAIFPGIETFEPRISKKIFELYSKWLPAIGYRVPQANLMEHFAIYYRLVENYEKLMILEKFEDLERALNGDKICLLLHIEGAEAIDDPYDLVLLKKLGLRSIGLTWNYTNKYASGCSSKKDTGLSDEGEELIRTANKLGIIVDLAHASKRTALEAMEISNKPVLISHSNIRNFVDTPRNVDDEILENLSKKKGVIGLSCIGSLISNKPTLEDLVKHFLYVYERYGADILAIGTDFLGLMGLPAPESLESVDKLPLLLKRLEDAGLSDNEIAKIAYGNALRIIKENIG